MRMRNFLTWENINNLMINVFLMVIVVFSVLIYVDRKTRDRFYGSEFEEWIEKLQTNNTDIDVPDRATRYYK